MLGQNCIEGPRNSTLETSVEREQQAEIFAPPGKNCCNLFDGSARLKLHLPYLESTDSAGVLRIEPIAQWHLRGHFSTT
jgi:hypothetical protein